MDLQDRTVLVAGGTGEVGEGIVGALLRRHARVVVPSRSASKVEQLRDRLGGGAELVGISGDPSSAGGAAELAGRVQDIAGGLDAIVVAIGRWASGPELTALDDATWRRVLDGGVGVHFAAARALLPLIADRSGASYTLINGSGATSPVAGSGPSNVSAAAQLMLGRVLAREHRDRPVRINTLLLDTPVATRSREHVKPEWLTADEAGRYVAWLVSDAAADVDAQVITFGSRNDLPAGA